MKQPQQQYKLLFIGPVASGKTTAIRTLCGDSFVSTEARPTDDVLAIKNKTTVAMDYGVFNFGGSKKLHLYGAPGQERFQFMTDILLEGCLGIALLVNVSYTALEDIPGVVEFYRQFISQKPCAVGLTHTEQLSAADVEQYKTAFSGVHLNISSVSVVDPRRQRDVAQLVENIVLNIR